MIKVDIAKIVYQRHGGISFAEARDLVELILGSVKKSLVNGESVKLSGFGTLNVIQRKGRLGRNPQTGERMELASSRYVTFRPSRLLSF